MRNYLLIFVSFFLLSFFVFGNNIDLFFAQDDFILIEKFSQNIFFSDFKSIFSTEGTHFRPMHNLYFFLLGNLFDKNYILYHLCSLLVHTIAGFLVFRIAKILLQNTYSAMFAAFFYLVNSSHFVSLFWISGNAVEIAFCLFCASLLFWIKKRIWLSLLFFTLAFLTSEAFVIGALIMLAYDFLKKGKLYTNRSIASLVALTGLLAVARFVYLTPKNIYDTYQIKIGLETFFAIKYYILKILGFAEFSGDFIVSILLIVIYGVLVKRIIDTSLEIKKVMFYILIISLGLFPFIFLPYHLSPHYMNLSIFGFSLFLGLAMEVKSKMNFLICLLFLLISSINVNGYFENHWVVIKSRIAEAYIKQIENAPELPKENSTLVFANNRISSSLDAYLALGGGKALDFWFKDKGYKYCFVEFEECSALP